MKILTVIKNDSLSISPQTNRQPSLIKKIKKLIGNLLSFIENHIFSMHSSKSTISKQVTTPLNLSLEILQLLEEEKRSKGNKEEINEFPYDIPTHYKPIYDTPRKEDPIYEEIDDSHHRVDDRKITKDIPPPLPPRNW